MKTTRHPFVSVLMSVYNDAKYLPGAVDSILGQVFGDFEFVVIDDGSTDGSRAILERYCDPRLVLVRQEHEGLVRSLNRGLSVASGRYVARQDADDISLPSRLLKQVAFLEAHPDVALVGSAVDLIDDDMRVLRRHVYPTEHLELCSLLDKVVNPLPHSTIMFRRDVVAGLGGYDERFTRAEDYALYLRLVERFSISSIPEVLVCLRYRLNSTIFGGDQAEALRSAVLARALAAIRRSHPDGLGADALARPEFLHRFERWFQASTLPRRFMAGKYRRAAEIRWARRDYAGALLLLARALGLDPAWPVKRLLQRGPGFWDSSSACQVLELVETCGGTGARSVE